MEEAEKRRQLRQARNSCQVTSPEVMMDNMTIPFTRYSPYRHTVKDIVSKPHLSTSHSSEDMLATHDTALSKLSLLRQEDDTDRSRQVIDVRRPMSMASKVKAKITSPDIKKRKH
uniref:Uncharacterized protein n=1 Tax=Arion vulgaris TaxID=1028688 RepID=A0A0B7A714_9EUPU